MHGLAVYVKEGLPFAQDLSLENSADSVSKIDQVLSINPSANVFVFADFNVHHKDWLTYSGGTDRPGELCCNLKPLYSWLVLVRRSQNVILTVLLFWIYLFHLMLIFVLQWLSLYWEILIMLLS